MFPCAGFNFTNTLAQLKNPPNTAFGVNDGFLFHQQKYDKFFKCTELEATYIFYTTLYASRSKTTDAKSAHKMLVNSTLGLEEKFVNKVF
jgi:hypothetical protein